MKWNERTYMLKKYIKRIMISYYDGLNRILSFYGHHCMNVEKKSENCSDSVTGSIEKLKADGYVYNKPFCNQLKLKNINQYDLSLLVPVYNAKNFLDQCLNFLLNQNTQYKYQIVIVNDGSTDGTDEILHKYENIENVVICKQNNGGISSARNRALELADGKYVGFIDNDDLVSSDYVEKLVSKAYTSNADVVKCGYTIFDEGGIIGNQIGEAFSSRNGFGSRLMKYDGLIFGGIFLRKLFLNVSFPVSYWYEDMVTRTLIYPICNNVEYLSEALYNKRDHASNASKVVWKKNIKCMDQIFLTREIQRRQRELGYVLQSEDIHALIYEYSYMASKRIVKKYLKEAFYCSLDAVLELLNDEKSHQIKFNDTEMEFVKAVMDKDYRMYCLVMKKMHLLDMDLL